MASTTTTYGYKKPTNGDKGTTWFVDLNANTDRLDAHDHDGVDSAVIPAKNISKGSSSILIAGWAAVAGEAGTYEQTITLPSGYVMGSITMQFYVNSGAEAGHQIYPTILYVSSSSYKIQMSDNSIDVKAVYA